MDRISLKTAAKEQIKGKIGILFIISIIVVGISFIAGMILGFIPFIGGLISSIFITPAFSLSIVLVYLKVADGKTPVAGDAFEGFYDFWSAFKVTFFVNLFTTLWSLLFIVPGIIKSFSYSMAMYILAENKGMSALEAINKSKAMMDGKKMDLFVLGLSFIGWSLLCFITFGIASIWVVPYMSATYTNFYKALKPVETIEATETVVE